MPEKDIDLLRKRIQEGVQAAEELERLLKQEERGRRKRNLRLIKGGGIGGAIWAGVEWLVDPRKIAVGLAAAVIGAGAAVSEDPGSPGSDPPEGIRPPAAVSPSTKPAVKPTVKPTVKPSPPRTSPLRTLGRSSTPVATPRKTPARTKVPQATPTPTPSETASPSLTETVTPTLPKTSTLPAAACVVDLLGVKLCLPRGRS